jgi:5-hydroxyisourate hydrolase
MTVSLYATSPAGLKLLRQVVLNGDGRGPDGPLLSNDELRAGTYRLVFDVAAYFKRQGVALPDPPFLDQVPLDFGIAHASQHYHVPLVCTPWTYSTYRGS